MGSGSHLASKILEENGILKANESNNRPLNYANGNSNNFPRPAGSILPSNVSVNTKNDNSGLASGFKNSGKQNLTFASSTFKPNEVYGNSVQVDRWGQNNKVNFNLNTNSAVKPMQRLAPTSTDHLSASSYETSQKQLPHLVP
jgi:hypothetical protein